MFGKTKNRTNEPRNKRSNEEDNNTTNNSSYGIYSFVKVFSYKHILEAARLCKRNVYWKASVQNFMRAVHYNCAILFYQLHKGKFNFQKTNEFDTRERGKERHIKSIKIRDRVIQKVICIYCLLPLFAPSFIYDNCASLKGKGISFAFNRLKAMLQKYYRQYGNHGYVLRFDFKNYFGSIDHEIAIQMIGKKVKDKRLLDLIRKAINVYSENDSNVGIGLGSELSQFIALLYANSIDHLIKDKLRFKYYIRYMDDGIIICNSKEELQQLLVEIKKICEELHLTLNDKKTTIVPLEKGFNFLKKRVILTDSGKIIMKISRDTVTRMRRKLKGLKDKMLKGEVSIKNIEDAYVAWRGFVEKFNAYDTINNMNNLYYDLFGYVPISKKDIKIKNKKAEEKRFNAVCELAKVFFNEDEPYLTYREQYFSNDYAA